MGYISEYLSNSQVSYTLAGENRKAERLTGKSVPITGTIERGARTINFATIDYIYKYDAVSFNTVNKMIQTIMSAKNSFFSEKKAILTYFNKFFDLIGDIGNETTKDKLYEYILKDLFMYGNSFIENIYDDKDEIIMDLKMIKAESMDYVRNGSGEILVDKYSRPIGYTMKLPNGISARGKGDEVPEDYRRVVSKGDNQLFLLPKRISHFKINTFGDRYWGVGILEPIVEGVTRKMKLEEAQTNSIYQRGTYPVIAKVGDLEHEPSEAELNAVLDNLKNMRHDRYFAFPYFVDIQPLEAKQSDVVDNTMLYLTTNQAAAAGIPLPFATGAGEATNRATLNNQQQMWELVLEYYAKEMTTSFERMVLRRISEVNGLSGYPTIVWGDIKAEEKNDKAKRISMAIADGSIAPEEARPYILEVEDLIANEKAYASFKKVEVVKKKPSKNTNFEEDEEKKEITTKKQ